MPAFLNIFDCLNIILTVLFVVCFSFNFIYPVIALFGGGKHRKAFSSSLRRYVVMISARNESGVIGKLVESIKLQDYPSGLVDVFVVADNCTDDTAEEAIAAGAYTVVRHDCRHIGKGYALDYLYKHIMSVKGGVYDGFFVFDADNLLSGNYISEMNKTFRDSNTVLTSLRSSKNFGDNWLSASYSMGFLFQSEFLNAARASLGLPCAVSGTGFLIGADILKRYGGWKFYTLTEDAEFTAQCVIDGIDIGYCGNAVFYDEQPTELRTSCRQRLRWAKGNIQVIRKYWVRLAVGAIKGKFGHYDMFTSLLPVAFLTVFGMILNLSGLVLQTAAYGVPDPELIKTYLFAFLNAYFSMWLTGAVTLITRRRTLNARPYELVAASFAYPVYLMLYLPISVAALFSDVRWTPVKHCVAKSITELETKNTL